MDAAIRRKRRQKRLNGFTLCISSLIDAQNIKARSSAPWVSQRERELGGILPPRIDQFDGCHRVAPGNGFEVNMWTNLQRRILAETVQVQRISNKDKLSENVFPLDKGGAMFRGLLAKRCAKFKRTSAMTTQQTLAKTRHHSLVNIGTIIPFLSTCSKFALQMQAPKF